MPLDAVTLRAVVHELQPVVGSRVDRLHQPAPDEVLLALRGPMGNVRLLLSANPGRPRLQLTALPRENPAAPPMFCMLLRKHLSGGRLTGLTQPGLERVVRLDFDIIDELGEPGTRSLILEAMGRRANLILLNGDGRILDCIRRVDPSMSPDRPVLPGLFYRLPPDQGKADFLETEESAIAGLLAAAPEERKISDWLLDTFSGLSPLLCRETAFLAVGDTEGRITPENRDAVKAVLFRLHRRIRENDFTPVVLTREDGGMDFSCLPILQYGPVMEERKTFSDLLDGFYAARDLRERMQRQGRELFQTVSLARDRLARKLAAQKKELEQAGNREKDRKYGDLVTANLYRMERGMQSLKTEDFYDPDQREIEIPLDPLLTPQQNAARYYKRYNKAKTAEQVLLREVEKGEEELRYLDSVADLLSRAESESELEDIRRELESGGWLKKRGGRKAAKRPPARPLEFHSSSGVPILVGRSNTQNDELTLRTARKDEIWLHVQKQPGSHVILRTEGREPDQRSLVEAAQLAAYYSRARDSQNVPVDWTRVRCVKKPSGARPGMVIYTNYSTLTVDPKGPGGR